MKDIETTILKKMNVQSANELCAYVYDHGNDPKFEIYRKCDIVVKGTNKVGVNTWDIRPGSPLLKSSLEYVLYGYKTFSDERLKEYEQMMKYAKTLQDASDYIQSMAQMKYHMEDVNLILKLWNDMISEIDEFDSISENTLEGLIKYPIGVIKTVVDTYTSQISSNVAMDNSRRQSVLGYILLKINICQD